MTCSRKESGDGYARLAGGLWKVTSKGTGATSLKVRQDICWATQLFRKINFKNSFRRWVQSTLEEMLHMTRELWWWWANSSMKVRAMTKSPILFLRLATILSASTRKQTIFDAWDGNKDHPEKSQAPSKSHAHWAGRKGTMQWRRNHCVLSMYYGCTQQRVQHSASRKNKSSWWQQLKRLLAKPRLQWSKKKWDNTPCRAYDGAHKWRTDHVTGKTKFL